MADKEISIDELGSAEVVKLEDKLVVQQDGVAKQVSFDTVDDLLTYVKEVAQATTGSGDGGTNIITIFFKSVLKIQKVDISEFSGFGEFTKDGMPEFSTFQDFLIKSFDDSNENN